MAAADKTIITVAALADFYREGFRKARVRTVIIEMVLLVSLGLLAWLSGKDALYWLGLIAAGITEAVFQSRYATEKRRLDVLDKPFPKGWRSLLEEHVLYYENLAPRQRLLFEKRVQIFLAEKKVEGIDTEVDDLVRLLVASSAIIPTFAFPAFTYPELNEVLVYPASFSKTFESGRNKQEENIEGMVGNRFMNRSLLLSKPALLAGFRGRPGHARPGHARPGENNVGIHEFVHLLDREDGETDGVPERLMQNEYVLPWLHLIRKETKRIKRGQSDINPYAITNNAEFLAVVSEYFFNDPEDFSENHPELYRFLTDFYHQRPA